MGGIPLLQFFKQYAQWFPPKPKKSAVSAKATSAEETHNALLPDTPAAAAGSGSGGKGVAGAPPNPRQCTLAWTGKEFKEQPWYFCYTCFDEAKAGCCSACAATCHLV